MIKKQKPKPKSVLNTKENQSSIYLYHFVLYSKIQSIFIDKIKSCILISMKGVPFSRNFVQNLCKFTMFIKNKGQISKMHLDKNQKNFVIFFFYNFILTTINYFFNLCLMYLSFELYSFRCIAKYVN